MRKLYLLLLLLVLWSGVQAQKYLQVQFSSQEDIPLTQPGGAAGNTALILSCRDEQLQHIFDAYSITVFKKEYPSAHLVKHSNAALLDRVYHIECASDVEGLYKQLVENPVSSIQGPVYLLDPPQALALPDDYALICFNTVCVPRCANRQNDLINAPAAWAITTGDTNIRVGITDDGFRKTQEDLAGKIVYDSGPVSASGYSHGTAVAILAAGNTNNGAGIASIGYNSKVDLHGIGINSIIQAAINGARIVNCSWVSTCSFNSYEQMTIDMVYDVYHTVIVAAAGNGPGICSSLTAYIYPASYNHVIAVGAVGHINDIGTLATCPNSSYKDIYEQWPRFLKDTVYSFTRNDSVDLCAPAYAVTSARTDNSNPDHNYGHNWGTSFASPQVAGAAALILSVNPALTPDDVEAILKCTARDLYEMPRNARYLNQLGSGRLDAGKAVQLAQTWVPGTGMTRQPTPSDIRWYELLSNGTDTIEVESASCAGLYPGRCNVGFRLEVVSADPGQAFKWLGVYTEHDSIDINSFIRYGTSINVMRGVDYPMVNSGTGALKVAVRVDECVPGTYYSEIRSTSCLGTGCPYSCDSAITITGLYATPLTESASWIRSSGQTNIDPSTSVRLDASPLEGYVALQPVAATDFFVAAPANDSSMFVAQALNGCVGGAPGKPAPMDATLIHTSRGITLYPNPTGSIAHLDHLIGNEHIEVSDMYGHVVFRKTNDNASMVKIDLEHLASGVYLVRVNGTEFIAKLIRM